MGTIRIAGVVCFDETDLRVTFIRASGPGGQNVNKVATAVQLRLDVAGSGTLPDHIKARVKAVAGRRLTRDGELVIEARRFRTQERNRADAMERLARILAAAAVRRPARIRTKPTVASRRRRLEQKRNRGAVKKLRRGSGGTDT